MRLFGLQIGRAPAPLNEARSVINLPNNNFGSDIFRLIGLDGSNLPNVTVETALQVPAFSGAVNFLSNSLAALPLHLFDDDQVGGNKSTGAVAELINSRPNLESTSFALRKWFWAQVFTGGRGLLWIERSLSGVPVALWPMDPSQTQISRVNSRLQYRFAGNPYYPAADVIDVCWQPRADMVGHYSPVQRGSKAIQLALAMNEYASNIFSKGGVPPLVLEGPMGANAQSMRQAHSDINQAIKIASDIGSPIIQIPKDFKLMPVGFNPSDGQLVEGRKYAVTEIARIFGLPPVFLQDLEKGTFSNTEQQDLQLMKHLIVPWCVCFEQELNLKLGGSGKKVGYVKHNLSALQRGDFKTQLEGLAKGVNSAIYSPNDARGYLDLPPNDDPAADKLHIQGATVPIDQNLAESGVGNDN